MGSDINAEKWEDDGEPNLENLLQRLIRLGPGPREVIKKSVNNHMIRGTIPKPEVQRLALQTILICIKEAENGKYEHLWDNLGEASEDFDKLADAYIELRRVARLAIGKLLSRKENLSVEAVIVIGDLQREIDIKDEYLG